jgi:hypothetical protein
MSSVLVAAGNDQEGNELVEMRFAGTEVRK